MYRVLSQILVFSLLVVVPVSFSTDSIPSLDAPCLKTTPLTQSRKATISIVERTGQPCLEVVLIPSDKLRISDPLFTSQSICCLWMPLGRAPPVSHSA
jgi:hypothetical protein